MLFSTKLGNKLIRLFHFGCAQLLDFLALKRIINWSSFRSAHDDIVSSLSVGCQVSVRCDEELRWLKQFSLTWYFQ